MLKSHLAINPPVAFRIFGAPVYWYGVIITLGMVAAILLCMYLVRHREGFKKEDVLDVALGAIPLGVLGARLFFVLSYDKSISNFFNFGEGGLSIIGGIIGGSLGLFIVCLIKKRSSLVLRDVIVPCVLVAQAIGRWGNFVNQEVYGHLVKAEAWQWFPYAVKIGNSWHLALFFYESVFNILGAVLMYIGLRKIKINGIVGFAYFLYYGFERSLLEGLRDPEFILTGIDGIMASRLFSIMMFIIGAVGITYLMLDHKYQLTKRIKAKLFPAKVQPESDGGSPVVDPTVKKDDE